MIYWRMYPFVRICVSFILGILAERILPGYQEYVILIISMSLGLLFYKDFKNGEDVKFSFYSGLLILVLFFCLGYVRSYINLPTLDIKHYSHYTFENDCGIGIIQEIPIKRTSLRTEIEIEKLCNGKTCVEVNQKAIIYFQNSDQIASNYKPGDRIFFNSKLTRVSKTSNPFAFDFQGYLWDRGITHQTYVWNKNNHYLINQNNLPLPIQMAMNSRAGFLKIFDKYLKDEDQNSIASAMILGYRNTISEEMYKAFSDTGSVHILAVSGMHLGILAGVLIFFFDMIKVNSPFFKNVKVVLMITILWFFALITGAAPAIMRAAVMFTFILYARYNKQFHNIYNILAFCGILMLIYNPYMVYQASFQFSFLAMLSLSYFQPHILKLWTTKYKLLHYIWTYISAALAAQILVVPFTIYFFHKFPVYFIISGVVSVWLSTIALYAGLVVMAVEYIYAPLNKIAVPIFKWFLDMFIKSVQWIETLPLCSIDGLTLSRLEFILIGLFLFILMLYVLEFRVKYLYSMAIISAIVIISIIIRIHKANYQAVCTIYDVNKSGMVDFFDGTIVYNISLDSIPENQQRFICLNNRMYHFGKDIVKLDLGTAFEAPRFKLNNYLIQFNKKVFVILSDDIIKNLDLNCADYVLLMNNCKYNKNIQLSNNNIVVIDKSFTISNANEWKDACNELGITIIDIRIRGSITLIL